MLFDLVDWYRQYVNKSGAFELQYTNAHLGLTSSKVTYTVASVCHACTVPSNSEHCSPITTEDDLEAEDQLDIKFNDLENCLGDVPNLQDILDTDDENTVVMLIQRRTTPWGIWRTTILVQLGMSLSIK